MSDPETLNVYAAQADDYAQMSKGIEAKDPALAAFIAALPKGAPVLDLGCGPGDSAAAMARAGLNVTATDAVQEMVDLAQRHDGVQALRASFDDLSEVAHYAGIWANFSLLHAPKADFPRHLKAIKTALRPGGLFHIAMKEGTGATRDTIGRHYSYYTPQELRAHLAKAGFTVKDMSQGSAIGLDGTRANWVSLRAYD